MTESDDPATTTGLVMLVGGAAVGGAAAAGAFSSKGAPKMPAQAVDKSKTAEALPQGSEAAKKKRKLAASVMARDFQAPTLGTPGLLGI